MSADDTKTCECGHADDWHEGEPPYPCISCKCSAFRLRVAEQERDALRGKLALAEQVLRQFKEVPCLRDLLGESDEDSFGCGCMGCQSRAYFAAATPTTETTDGE